MLPHPDHPTLLEYVASKSTLGLLLCPQIMSDQVLAERAEPLNLTRGASLKLLQICGRRTWVLRAIILSFANMRFVKRQILNISHHSGLRE